MVPRTTSPHTSRGKTRLYISHFLPQTRCSAKLGLRLQRGSKWTKSAIFGIFSVFQIKLPNYSFKKKDFVYLNLDLIKRHLFHFSESLCNNFQQSYPNKKLLKLSKLRKSAKPLKILTKDGQRRTVLKFITPPNLLKEENVSHYALLGLPAGARAEHQST